MASATQTIESRSAVRSELNTAVKQSATWGFGGIAVKAAGFVMLPLYTHYLTPGNYGVWELLDLIMSLLGMLLNLGLTAAVLKYYAAAESKEDQRRVISTSFVFSMFTGLAVYGVGVATIPLATRALFGPGVSSVYLFLSFTLAVMAYVAAVPYTLLRAKDQARRLVAYDTAGMAVMLALSFFFVVVLKLGLMGALLSPLLVGTAKTILIFFWTRHDIGISADRAVLRHLLFFGAPLVLSNLTMFVLNFSDRFFLREFRSLEVLGIYAVGYKFAYILNFLVIQPFNMMWQSRMFVIHRQSDHQSIFRHMFVLYSLLLIACGLGLSLFGPTLVPLLVDPRYIDAASIIPVVTLAYVLLGMGYFLQLGMLLAARTGLIGLVSAISAVTTLILNWVLIRAFGMQGAAWATLLGFLVLAVGSYICSDRVFPLPLGIGRVLKALLLAIAVYLAAQFVPLSGRWAVLLWKTAAFAVYGLLAWGTGVLSAEEMLTMTSVRQSAVRATMRFLKPVWGRA